MYMYCKLYYSMQTICPIRSQQGAVPDLNHWNSGTTVIRYFFSFTMALWNACASLAKVSGKLITSRLERMETCAYM